MDKEQERLQFEDKIRNLEEENKSLKFQNRELKETIKRLENNNLFPYLNIVSGSTTMTIAELVVRECSDKEWLKSVRYYIDCAINEPRFDKESEVDNGSN